MEGQRISNVEDVGGVSGMVYVGDGCSAVRDERLGNQEPSKILIHNTAVKPYSTA